MNTGSIHHRAWIKKIGALSFTFFLVKGLLWLAAPLLIWVFA